MTTLENYESSRDAWFDHLEEKFGRHWSYKHSVSERQSEAGAPLYANYAASAMALSKGGKK